MVEKNAMLIKGAFQILFGGSFSQKGYPTTLRNIISPKKMGEIGEHLTPPSYKKPI